MEEGSNKFTLLFFGIAAAVVLLAFVVPPLANMFAGLGIEIPAWALRLSPNHPLRALSFASVGIGVAVLAALLVHRVLSSK